MSLELRSKIKKMSSRYLIFCFSRDINVQKIRVVQTLLQVVPKHGNTGKNILVRLNWKTYFAYMTNNLTLEIVKALSNVQLEILK